MPVRFKIVIVSVLATLLAGGSYPLAQGKARAAAPPTDDQTIIHVLNRLGFGPTPGAVEHVRQIGVSAYVEEQLRPERIADTLVAARLEGFATLTKSSRELAETYFLPAMMERRQQQRKAGQDPSAQPSDPPGANPQMRSPEQMQNQRMQRTPIAELSQQRMVRAAYSERQLEEALVDFWFNHFNVFVGKGQVRLYLTEYEREAIRPHVLGKFRDLLGATAHSPAMLFYLDNWQSTAAEGAPTSAEAQARRPMARQRLPGRRQPAAQPRRLPPDAHAGRPAAAATDAPPRRERKLRARADGAAHARSRGRLHAEGRPGSRTGVHRLDHRESASWRLVPLRAPVARRWREDRARAPDQAGRRSQGRRADAGSAGEASVHRALHCRQARATIRVGQPVTCARGARRGTVSRDRW